MQASFDFVRSRDHFREANNPIGGNYLVGLGKSHLVRRLIFVGIPRALVGVSSSFYPWRFAKQVAQQRRVFRVGPQVSRLGIKEWFQHP